MIKAIAFDLDDTLLDTTGILVPKASQDAFQILINSGLKLTLEECEQQRLELIKNISHKDAFQQLAQQYGTPETLQSLNAAISAFYEPSIPEKLPLLEGARENIDYLKDKYQLFMVTAGAEKTQRKKAQALGVSSDFKKIYVTNSFIKERKEHAFQNIIESMGIKSSELLCVGNSLSSEITDALKIGSVACYFEFGEDRGSVSALKGEQPHFHVRSHLELLSTCKL